MTQCYYFLMRNAGFVLAGGRSSRMGRDKALLPYGQATLLEAMATRVLAAAGHVALIGDAPAYGKFGYPVYPDRFPARGPIAGLDAALSLQLAEWNLVVACDMPRVTTEVLSSLLERTHSIADPYLACVIPLNENGGFEPLCAVYHSTCLSVVERSLGENRFKMKVLLSELRTVGVQEWPSGAFTNINTPGEWADLKQGTGS